MFLQFWKISFQVSCAVGSCHATWLKGYTQDDLDHLAFPSLNWKTDTLAFHWTHPDPVEFNDRNSLLKSNSTVAQIGKFVLFTADLL